jgi:hypothetical protein
MMSDPLNPQAWNCCSYVGSDVAHDDIHGFSEQIQAWVCLLLPDQDL